MSRIAEELKLKKNRVVKNSVGERLPKKHGWWHRLRLWDDILFKFMILKNK